MPETQTEHYYETEETRGCFLLGDQCFQHRHKSIYSKWQGMYSNWASPHQPYRGNDVLDVNEAVGNAEPPHYPEYLHVLIMSPHCPQHLHDPIMSPHCPEQGQPKAAGTPSGLNCSSGHCTPRITRQNTARWGYATVGKYPLKGDLGACLHNHSQTLRYFLTQQTSRDNEHWPPPL